MELSNAKGTRDLTPEQCMARQEVVEALKKVFELFGYVPLETPVIENYAVLSSKYAGGAEILKEMFKLKDQGDRELCLRYDLTVPLARFVGQNPNLKMPFKRYQIGEVFRDGPIKLGRYRQFTQCDIDAIGVKEMTADAEMISIAQEAFKGMKLDVTVKVNNRKALNGLLESLGVKKEKQESAILAIDKLEKTGEKAVKKELEEKGIAEKTAEEIMKAISMKGSNKSKLAQLQKMMKSEEGKQGLKEVEEALSYVDDSNVEFDVSLARGLSYYTGTVFEAFLKKGEIKSAVAGGGRYDKMIGQFLQSAREYPAVGISFGLDVIIDATGGKDRKTATKAYIIPIQTTKESLKIANELRKENINTDMDLSGRGISKNLNYANSTGIPFVIIIGEQELKEKKIKLKDMTSGEEKMVTVKEAVRILKG